MKRRYASNSLILCLAKIDEQLKTEARSLRKEDKNVEGMLKEAILNNENEDDSEEHDKRERNVFEILQ